MLTPSDYLTLFNTCKLTDVTRKLDATNNICTLILADQSIYKTVEQFTSVPWPLIAAIHFRESNQNFGKHLHNGDSLNYRTVHAPIGRPKTGNPPFTWVDSAIDALDGTWRPKTWDTPGSLEFLERYNGVGYQKHGVNTPYLWDYTDKYTSGLFIADGTFNPDKAEDRPGCVIILKTLLKREVTLDFSALDTSHLAIC